jgi:HK97 family phage major capsid protein/HK97 family phage prohead protease
MSHHHRAVFDLEQRAQSNGRTFAASLSSEEPYEREDGYEILDHSPGAVDLSRAKDGLPLLFGHDQSKPVGMIQNIRIVAKKLRAELNIFETIAGNEALAMIQGGLRSISVGYTREAVQEAGTKDGVRIYKVKKWMPYESSLVSVPADPTVGINRSHSNFTKVKIMSVENQAVDEKSELNRVKTLYALGTQYAQYVKPHEVRTFVEAGKSESDFMKEMMSRITSKHTNVNYDVVDANPADLQRYSFGRAIVAQLTNDWREAGFERELSQEISRKSGKSPEGFYVPSSVWGKGRAKRDFNVGTAGEAGNLVQTSLQSDAFLDALRNELQTAALGLTVLTGLRDNVDLPRKSAISTLGMLTETGAASETQPGTSKATLSPKRIGAFVEPSKQALIQSAIALEQMLADDLIASAAGLIEDQIINGSGTLPNMRGIRNTAGIGAVIAGTNGLTVAWGHFTDLESACSSVNASPGQLSGYLTNHKVRNRAKNVTRGTNLPFIIDPDVLPGPDGYTRINGYRAAYSNWVPSNLTKGTSNGICSAAIFSSDWSLGVLGLFGPPDITIDPYTLAATGQVRITLNQYVDFAIRQPAAFAMISDMLTT